MEELKKIEDVAGHGACAGAAHYRRCGQDPVYAGPLVTGPRDPVVLYKVGRPAAAFQMIIYLN